MPVDQTVLDARSAMESAVSGYAVEGDCSSLAQARVAIQNYTDAVKTFKANNPSTPEDDYFSNPTVQTQARRDVFRNKMIGGGAVPGTGRSLLCGLWSTETNLYPTEGLRGRSVAFSPSGQWLAVGHDSGNGLTIYDTNDWSVVPGVPTYNSYNIGKVEFSADGNYLAITLNSDPRLEILRVSDWSVVDISAFSSSLTWHVEDIAWSPDTTTPQLAIAQGDLILADVSGTTATVATGPAPVNTDFNAISVVAYSPDGQYLAAAFATSSKDTVVWNRSDWSVAYQTPYVQAGNAMTFSHDSAYLALVTDSWGSEHGLQLWDTATWTLQTQSEQMLTNAGSVVFTINNDVVLATGRDSQTYGYRISDGSRIQCTPTLVNDGGFTYDAAVSPDGRLWAIGKADAEAVVVYGIFDPVE